MKDLLSLNDLFKNSVFRIPSYQRGYSWEYEQLEEFWEDVINLPENNDHYTGMLSLKELTLSENIEELSLWNDATWLLNKDYHAYHVVDGQQRLTTLIILIQSIIEVYRSKNKSKNDQEIIINDTRLSEIIEQFIVKNKPGSDNLISTFLFGYEVDKPSDDYLKNKILNPDYVGEINESFYTLNLDNAKGYFLKKLNDLYEKYNNFMEIEKIYRKITNKLKFNIYIISKDFNVNVAFETMNNRGKRLSNLELLKNRLIYLSSLLSLPDDEEKALMNSINDTWKTIYSYLGKNKFSTLPDDDFLIAHSYLYFGYIEDIRKGYSQFLLKKYFNQSRIFNGLIEENNNLFDNETTRDESPDLIEDTSENYADLTKKLTKKDIIEYINSLKSLAPYWYMLHFAEYPNNDEINEWITRLNRLEFNYFKPLVLVTLSKQNITDEEKIKLLESVERFIFIVFRLCGYQATYNRNPIYNYTHSLYLDEIDIKEIINFINKLDVLSDNNVISLSAVTSTITRLFKRDGFYSWSANRYFLYEYESSLVEKYSGTKKITDDYFLSKKRTDMLSIEHIFPQSENSSYWMNIFSDYSLDQRNRFRGTLGNLLPLSLDINRKLQDDNFEIKCNRYEVGSYSEQEISKKEIWNDKRILDRGLSLVGFLEARWKFNFENNKDRKIFLGLDFMIEENDEKTNVHIPVYDKVDSVVNTIYASNLEEELYLSIGEEIYAKGFYKNGGILVKAGSKLRLGIVAADNNMQQKVDNARKNPKIKNNIYIEDEFYDNPSLAANVILGNSKNGWSNWKNSAGKTLDELVRNQ